MRLRTRATTSAPGQKEPSGSSELADRAAISGQPDGLPGTQRVLAHKRFPSSYRDWHYLLEEP
jgi:hypothetical protein